MTIKEIAALCGVSRGTVDRVINHRGRVSEATEQRVLAAIKELGYKKNIAGRGLTVRKLSPEIGIILSSQGNPFFDDVMLGMGKAENEYKDYGLSLNIMTMRGYSVKTQIAMMEALSYRASAMIIHPINDPLIISKINDLYGKGIPVITVNSDIEGSRRLCYVGSDYAKGGRAAAGILRLAAGPVPMIGILSGVESILGHSQRLMGFLDQINNMNSARVIACQSIEDDNQKGYEVTQNMLRANNNINTLFVVAAGVEGVCRAAMEHNEGHQKNINVFAFDAIPAHIAMMRKGILKAVIDQEPFFQGYQSVKTAFDIILSGKLEPLPPIYTQNQIKILENV